MLVVATGDDLALRFGIQLEPRERSPIAYWRCSIGAVSSRSVGPPMPNGTTSRVRKASIRFIHIG